MPTAVEAPAFSERTDPIIADALDWCRTRASITGFARGERGLIRITDESSITDVYAVALGLIAGGGSAVLAAHGVDPGPLIAAERIAHMITLE